MKPLIGVVGRCGTAGDQFNNIKFPEKIRMCVIRSGGVPIGILPPQMVEYQEMIPSVLDELTDEEKELLTRQLDLCDGIIFPGGSKRFEYDLFILNYALKRNIPILGICLGMQILSMVDEVGNYVMNLEKIDSFINHCEEDKELAHCVELSKDSKLYSIIKKDKFLVNSRHHMKIVNPGTFNVCATSEDGVIEAIERTDKKFALGVQWHPEMMMNDANQKLIFDSFVGACRE